MSELDAKTLPDAIIDTEVKEEPVKDEPVKEEPVGEAGEPAAKPAPATKGGPKNPRIDRVKKEGNSGGPKKNGNMRKRTESWSQKDLQLSRALAGILRHGMWGFQPDDGGFLFLDDILQHHHFKSVLNVSYEDLKR